MASKRMVRREKKREHLEKRYREKRAELRAQLNDPSLDINAKFEAQNKIEQLPRDAAKVRRRNRCKLTGRGRGVYRKFGLGRNALREVAMKGEVPGLCKASW